MKKILAISAITLIVFLQGELTAAANGTTTAPPPTTQQPDCSINGLYGMYYNLPKNHPNVETAITGVVTGHTPSEYNWYSDQYLSFKRNDSVSMFNNPSKFFPVNEGKDGDPYYFAIHWTGYVIAPSSGDYTINIQSDDDSWVYINSALQTDLGGIHGLSGASKQARLDKGASKIDIYFAERHVVEAGIVFSISNNVTYSPCQPINPPTVAISSNPSTITKGDNSILTWSSTNADTCAASDGWSGTKSLSGNQSVTPSQTTNYKITCANAAGSASAQTTVTVNQPATPTADIKANNSDGPVTISYSSSASIYWTSSNADSCTVTPGNWNGTSGSNSTGGLTSDHTYTVRCSGAGGSAADSVTVQTQQLPAPSANITANPDVIDPGQSSTLTWNSQNADTCTASDGWSGTKSTSGSETVRTSALTTYRITCTNASGSATDIATVRVNSGSVPTVSLTANPQSVLRGNPSILTWTTSRADSCTASNGWSGSKSASGGNESVYSGQTTTYSINCSNQYGSSSDTATVSVYDDNNFPTVTLTANPTQINQGSYATLTWSSQNTTSCAASNGWSGQKPISGSESVNPNSTMLYTIICMGPRGSVSASATVSVINATTGTIITKNARNLTLNNANFLTSIEAQAGDEIEFEIRVRNPRSTTATLVIKDMLPVELSYAPQSTLVNGGIAADGITTANGISIYPVQPNEEKVITFRTKVAQNASQIKITNYATIGIGNDTLQTASATIQIRNRGTVLGAATVVTGPENALPWLLAIGFIGSLGLYAAMFSYRYAGVSSFGSALADIKLQIACWNIRRKERIVKTDLPLRPYDNDFI